MSFLRKIFGGIRMTWLLVLIFAVVTGVLTGVIMLVPFLRESAFVYIGISFEFWFIFAVFVVSNCKKPLEAGLKCFVFFLVSQPIVYLVQQPFVPGTDLIGTYYFYWFKWTLLTFPGGMIAYLIKRKDLLGTLVLSVAGGYLAFMGTKFVLNFIAGAAVSYLIYGLICIAAAAVFMLLFCPGKKLIVIYGLLLLAAVAASVIVSTKANAYCSYEIEAPGEWTVSDFEAKGIDVYITDGDMLNINYTKRSGTFTVPCVNTETGETLNAVVTITNGYADVEFVP